MYGLKLKSFLLKNEYSIGQVDNTLFTKKKKNNIVLVQIYVDDIIFGSTCQDLCDEFSNLIHNEIDMRMMDELNYFLGLQIKQYEDGTFKLCISSYVTILKKEEFDILRLGLGMMEHVP